MIFGKFERKGDVNFPNLIKSEEIYRKFFFESDFCDPRKYWFLKIFILVPFDFAPRVKACEFFVW